MLFILPHSTAHVLGNTIPFVRTSLYSHECLCPGGDIHSPPCLVILPRLGTKQALKKYPRHKCIRFLCRNNSLLNSRKEWWCFFHPDFFENGIGRDFSKRSKERRREMGCRKWRRCSLHKFSWSLTNRLETIYVLKGPKCKTVLNK